jgi:hypothetical protein
MSEEKQEVKVNCECGSVVLKKNYASHVKTKKHLAVVGGSTRKRGVNFADAQETDVADVDDYDAYANGVDGDDGEDGEDDFEEEMLGILEGMDEHIVILEKKMEDVFNRVEETRSKVNLCLGECREVAMNQPYAKQINELTNQVSGLTNAVNEMKTLLANPK